MKKLYLNGLDLKTFTQQDALDYCLLNSINPDNIITFELYSNELTDISGIKLFKNVKKINIGYNNLEDISVLKYLTKLKELYMHNNKITDISAVQYLTKLKILSISNLKLESDQIQYIENLKNLKELISISGFKNRDYIYRLNKNIIIKE